MSTGTPSAAKRIAIVGAGAGGLMAAIQAARTGDAEVILLDGAARPGAKILVSGGGRCNLTNRRVSAADFAGSTPASIRKILNAFDPERTLAFFEAIGVELREEALGKLFPVSGKARTVLDALMAAVLAAGVELRSASRVEAIEKTATGFRLSGPFGRLEADRVIIATGGCSLPKSGSDGSGYALAKGLGHSITPTILPALVPLLLPQGHRLRDLSGIASDVRLHLRTTTGKGLLACEGALLCTHFGISGPVVLDISRHYLARREAGEEVTLSVDWLPQMASAVLDLELQGLGRRSLGGFLRDRRPARLAEALCREAKLDPETSGDQLRKTARRDLLNVLKSYPLPICGDRGFAVAEVTAGGVPLSELDPATLESRRCPGLHLCGEICDVDGRIGGFNFQWAWSSGVVAGRGAAAGL